MKSLSLIVLLTISSVVNAAEIEINFTHYWEGKLLEITDDSDAKIPTIELQVTMLKYYVGKIQLVYAGGETYVDQAYHLIDAEKKKSMRILLKDVPEGKLISCSMMIGVDSVSNHEGLMDGDLDPMNGMYWAWNSGFINFKIEGNCNSCNMEDGEFKYHIGGFLAPNQTVQKLELDLIDKQDESSKLSIRVELSDLLRKEDLAQQPMIMSPSKKSSAFARKLPNLFSVE